MIIVIISCLPFNHPKMTGIDCTVQQKADFSEFDVIGFASGIAFGNYYLPLLNFIKENLPENKDVFFIHTAGSPKENQNRKVSELCEKKGCKCVGTYYCKGYAMVKQSNVKLAHKKHIG